MRVRVPGDKSITQRALILAALAEGESRLRGLLDGGDAVSTARALSALSVPLPDLPADGGEIRVRGVGLRGLCAPPEPLDLGNSGTGCRLLLGVLAGSGVTARFAGDASLCARPMARVTDPLSRMGARFTFDGARGRLPLTVEGAHPLGPLDWPSRVASAQVKSAILLAGLTGQAWAMVTEPRQSRDHTERLLAQVGAPVIAHAVEGGWRVELRDPPARIAPLDLTIPGDISSAAFLLALAVLGGVRGGGGAAAGGGRGLTVEGVGLNPTRTAFLDVLGRMGADIGVQTDGNANASLSPAGAPADAEASASRGPEPTGSVTAGPAAVRSVSVGEAEVPRLIDELPLVAVLGARAEGVTRITGASELRAKESDRIRGLAENLRALGVRAEELADGLEVEGTDRPLRGRVRTLGDHRIAMAFGVLGAVPPNDIEIDDPGAADVSFPGFRSLLDRLSGRGRAGPRA